MTSIDDARRIMGDNMIGPQELATIAADLGITAPDHRRLPKIGYSASDLERAARSHVLLLGVSTTAEEHPLTLNYFRSRFGTDPTRGEPCLYNQDWYLNERFAASRTVKKKWYLVGRFVAENTRAVAPADTERRFARSGDTFPSVILATLTFFANYFLHKGELLWQHDFIWCADVDHNGDRIYVGRYTDPTRMNRNGFNVHRHLSLRRVHAAVTVR